MNAVVLHGPRERHESWPGFVWRAWSTLERRHWAFTLLAAAIFAVTSLLSTLDYSESKKVFDPAVVTLAGVNPIVTALVVLLSWRLADAAGGDARGRWRRVAWAVALGSAVASVIGLALYAGSGVMSTMQAEWAAKNRPLPPLWLSGVSDWMTTVVTFGLFVAFGEMHLVRERIEAQARDVMQAQGRVARQVLESRLAAMQAQVEPQFLFDSLVDVRALYERAPAEGTATLDRLITYLRVALPRLRESGSTVDAEVELVRAYLSVVAARHGGRPRLEASVAADAGEARFYPMLLLPLVQRAVRATTERSDRSALPESIELGERRAGTHVVALLRFDTAGLCAEDSDLARVRQRLAGLYRGDAALKCSEANPGQTEFLLTVPYEQPHGDRR